MPLLQSCTGYVYSSYLHSFEDEQVLYRTGHVDDGWRCTTIDVFVDLFATRHKFISLNIILLYRCRHGYKVLSISMRRSISRRPCKRSLAIYQRLWLTMLDVVHQQSRDSVGKSLLVRSLREIGKF
jgi:hypothetical protein